MMHHHRIPILTLLGVALWALPRPAHAQRSCAEAFGDSLSRRTLVALDKVAAVRVWDDYTLGRHPLLLLADSTHRGSAGTPVCAAIWRRGVPLERIELTERPPFSTPIYGMIDSDSIGPAAIEGADQLPVVLKPAPPAVAAALRERGVTRAVVLNVPMTFAGLGRLGEVLASSKADPVLIQADLAVHESFHLHSQFPTWLDQRRTYAWPGWDRQPDRPQLRERCYAGTPAIAAAFDAEMQALLAAYDAVVVAEKRDKRAGRRHARRFVELRAERRRLQDTVTVAQGNRTISCELAENLMELEEGTTQWLGHATTVRAGLTTTARLRGPYSGTQPERFYQTGPLQLWILEGLRGPKAMRRITASIARSKGPEGSLFPRFARLAR